MSIKDTPLQRRIREAAAQINNESATHNLSLDVRASTARLIDGFGAMTYRNGGSEGGAFGLESLGSVEPTRNLEFNSAEADPETVIRELQSLNMSARHIEGVTEAVLTLLDGGYSSMSVLAGGNNISGNNIAPMSMVVGRTSAVGLPNADEGIALEAFGEDINRLNTDDRLSMSLIIMRPWDNILDKAFARVNDSSPIVTIRVPLPEVYDWSSTQRPGSTTQERHNNTPLRDLYRNPSRVNTAAKKIVAIEANDSTSVLWKAGNTQFYKVGVDVATLDLSRTDTKFGYGQVDRTDLVSDGGLLDNVLVSVKDPSGNGGAGVTETFKLETRAMALAMFVQLAANRVASDRIVNLTVVLPITSASKQWDGSNSTIAAKLTDAKLLVTVKITANLNLSTGMLSANGATSKALVAVEGQTISGATNTYFGQLVPSLAAYSVDTYFDEENQRKANLAVWCQYREMQFVVPRSRVFFTEYSLAQDVDEYAISATSSAMALGNGRRGLDILVNRLNDVAAGLDFIAKNPEVAKYNPVDEQSFVSSLVKPSVITAVMDFDSEEVNNMNESTRLSEIHGRFRARFLTALTQLMANSLMLNQYSAGETPVLKVFVHSTIGDLVIGILDYHPDLDDRATKASGADYSMKLPNGNRIDIIKTNLDCMKQRLYAVPVIESDMKSLLSAASIRDCGTVTYNYVPTNGGSVVRRVATTNREILMMSNPVGIMFEIKGLEKQLGEVGYGILKLNKDDNDALDV